MLTFLRVIGNVILLIGQLMVILGLLILAALMLYLFFALF